LLLLLPLRAARLPAGLLVPAAWLAGTGALAAERILLALAGVPWNLVTLGLPWLALALLARQSSPFRPGLLRPAPWRGAPRNDGIGSRPMHVVVAAVLLAWTAALFWRATHQPLDGWDAWAIWFLKGRVLYQESGLPVPFFTDSFFAAYAHLDYPLLVPLTIAGTYAWMGDMDTLMKGWWALLAGAAAAGIYWGLDRLVGRAARVAGLLLFLALPEVQAHVAGAYTGYADLPLAVLVLFGGIFLYRREPAAALFFALSGFTKNEGLVIAAVGLALAVVTVRPVRIAAPVAAACAALIVLPWQWERVALGIGGEFQPSASALIANWGERIGPILQGLTAIALDVGRFGLLWPGLVVVLALALPARRGTSPRATGMDERRGGSWRSAWPLMALLGAQLAAAVVAYVISPNDLTWHLATSGDRVLFQAAPLALLVVIHCLGAALKGLPVTAWRKFAVLCPKPGASAQGTSEVR
jgi:hypothetical protein